MKFWCRQLAIGSWRLRSWLSGCIASSSYACFESFWATKENITHRPRKPRRLKNADLEYDLSSSSVRNEAKIRRMLAMIMRRSGDAGW